MITSVLDQIREANYQATEEDIEKLAALHSDVSNTQGQTDGSYLKILLAGCQAVLGKGRKKFPDLKAAQHEVLDKTNNRYYEAVLRGVITEDIAITEGLDENEKRLRRVEQLRRATFARSAKSTLAAFVEAGGDMRMLDVVATSKGSLRKFVSESQGVPSWEKDVSSKRTKIEAICRRLAETNPGQAREILESVLSHLQDVLDSITGTTRRDTEKVVVFTAVAGDEVPAVVEVPEDAREPASMVASASEPAGYSIPTIDDFHEVSESAREAFAPFAVTPPIEVQRPSMGF